MRVVTTRIKGVLILEGYKSQDERGEFYKIYNEDEFVKNNINFNMKESYYSVSNKNVIRGMHFQLPPFNHDKLVSLVKGSIKDVIIDLRKNSESYKKVISISLKDSSNKSIYIPSGCAHGFVSLEDDTIVLYNVTTGYNKDNDTGVRWDSIGYVWRVDNPIISDRDKGFKRLEDFESPF
ncbi:MAG: dTDP-4-dehydrorhamnose 3,5-epimerase family protein [Clostridium sp.]